MQAHQKKRKPVRRNTRARKEPLPGWVWLIFGLGIGLSVALAVYLRDSHDTAATPTEVRQSASQESDQKTPAKKVVSKPVEKKEPKYSFYDMLPKFEVVIPEEEQNVRADVEPRAEERSGVYVLQAGSFTTFVDADRRRAQLAMQGIESSIQRVSIDDKTYHRVRIGPIDDLKELNTTRSRLRSAKIEVLVIRLGD